MKKNRVLISLGDPWGIGPEITANALDKLNSDELSRISLVGSSRIWDQVNKRGLKPAEFFDITYQDSIIPGKPPDDGGIFVYNTLLKAVEIIRDGGAEALVTAPVNKHLIQIHYHDFIGHTEFLAKSFNSDYPTMFFIGPELRVALATTHLPLRDVSNMLNIDMILNHLRNCDSFLKRGNNPNPGIGVCGLNPHAGESGAFGDEEASIITPAVNKACEEGIRAEGPFPADTLFIKGFNGTYSIILAMYHDQALTVFKSTDNGKGVNVTLGLPFIRTSPDHGTAYDIAGKEQASHLSMLEAIRISLANAFRQNILKFR